MKYYKDHDNNVFAFEDDGSQDAFIPEGLDPISEQEADELRFHPPTDEQIIAQYDAAVQQRLDDFAKTRNYTNIMSAATYASSTVPKFKAEGQYAVEVRDATWAKCYEVLAAVEAGSRPMPTLDELIAELPALVWPQ